MESSSHLTLLQQTSFFVSRHQLLTRNDVSLCKALYNVAEYNLLQISLQGNAAHVVFRTFSNMEPSCSHLLARDFLLLAKSHPPPTRCQVLRVSGVCPQQFQCALNRNDPLQEIQGG